MCPPSHGAVPTHHPHSHSCGLLEERAGGGRGGVKGVGDGDVVTTVTGHHGNSREDESDDDDEFFEALENHEEEEEEEGVQSSSQTRHREIMRGRVGEKEGEGERETDIKSQQGILNRLKVSAADAVGGVSERESSPEVHVASEAGDEGDAMGRLQLCGDLVLIATGEPLYVPVTQVSPSSLVVVSGLRSIVVPARGQRTCKDGFRFSISTKPCVL